MVKTTVHTQKKFTILRHCAFIDLMPVKPQTKFSSVLIEHMVQDFFTPWIALAASQISITFFQNKFFWL